MHIANAPHNLTDTIHTGQEAIARAMAVRQRRRTIFARVMPPPPPPPVEKEQPPEIIPPIIFSMPAEFPTLQTSTGGAFGLFYGYRIAVTEISDRHKIPSIRKIQDSVCELGNLTREDLLSQRRDCRVVKVRHVGMMLARLLTLHSFPEIGRKFAGRDHSTVLHACRKLAPVAAEIRPLIGHCTLRKLVAASFDLYDKLCPELRNGHRRKS